MEEKLLNILNELLQSTGRDKITSINDEMKLREDLGFDSFQLAELTVYIEEEFGIDIFEDGLIATIGEIKAKLK